MVHGEDLTEQMLRAWRGGASLEEIGDEAGMTRQAVSRRIRKVAKPADRAAARRAREARRQGTRQPTPRERRVAAVREARRRQARAEDHRCVVCTTELDDPRRKTCGGQCADDYAAARHRFTDAEGDDVLRLRNARAIVRNPLGYTAAKVRWALTLTAAADAGLPLPERNRTFVLPGSRASAIAARRGR